MDILTAVDAFVSIDAVLGSLNKQLLDARLYREKAETRHGKDSPMAQIAVDMAASAESAFQTRLIEVRQDKKIRRTAIRLLRAERKLTRSEAIAETDILSVPQTASPARAVFAAAFQCASGGAVPHAA